MFNHSTKLYFFYGVALFAAPVFCIFYIKLFSLQAPDPLWLFRDMYSFGLLVLFYPIIEELSFRGMIQEYLSHKVGEYKGIAGISLANILTSMLFVLMHFMYHAPVWALLVFFPSLVFGYFKEHFSSVIPSILLHSFYNLVFFSLVGR
jgi:membrane protease YdiL (CAAX protease family)